MDTSRFQSNLCDAGLDCALVFSFNNKDPNLHYLLGDEFEYSFLIVPKKGNSRLITSKLEYERARRFIGFPVSVFDKPAFKSVAAQLRRYRKIGINKSSISVNEFAALRKALPKRKWIDIGKLLRQTRKLKDGEEEKKLRIACKYADDIFSSLVRNFRFRTEMDIVKFLMAEASKRGCDLSFDPIVASGKHSSMPHYKGLPVPLKKGFCVIDFGVLYEGYRSDITRTIHIGRATGSERDAYCRLLEVQEQTIKSIRRGMKGSALMEITMKLLGKDKEKMIHGLGHGIGVEIHELPSLSTNSEDVIEDGDIFTIEPGVYYPGKFGIRIEDDVMIKNGKVVVLTHADKRMIEVRA
jgi:Xaa-Pro aminopeptidase